MAGCLDPCILETAATSLANHRLGRIRDMGLGAGGCANALGSMCVTGPDSDPDSLRQKKGISPHLYIGWLTGRVWP